MKLLIAISLLFTFCITKSQVSDFKNINFNKADRNAVINKDAELNNLAKLSYKLTKNLSTDVEKFRAIYFWVANNISSDNRMHTQIINKRTKYKNDSVSLVEWNKSYQEKFYKNLIKRKKTICTGFAYLVKKLANFSGIECEIIDGYGRSVDSNILELEIVNHSWNAVKLNEKWYLCDATWSSGYDLSGVYIREYNNGLFLTEPELFALNHYPLDKKWLLTNQFTADDFTSRPLLYSAGLKYKIQPISPISMKVEIKKKEIIQFEFRVGETIDLKKISLIDISTNGIKKLKIYDLENKNNIIKFKYIFKRRGINDVHLAIGDDIIATYSVKVNK